MDDSFGVPHRSSNPDGGGGGKLPGGTPPHIAEYLRHKKIDRLAADIRVAVEREFDSLRRSLGQRFRWMRHDRENRPSQT